MEAMGMDPDQVSSCCKKPVNVGGDDDDVTRFYYCSACGKACDVAHGMAREGYQPEAEDSVETNQERIKRLFSELYDLAKRTWPPHLGKERRCQDCKKSFGVAENPDYDDVNFCQKCGKELEKTVRRYPYHWPHVHRLYAMLSYRANPKKKDWRTVVDATAGEFISMDRY